MVANLQRLDKEIEDAIVDLDIPKARSLIIRRNRMASRPLALVEANAGPIEMKESKMEQDLESLPGYLRWCEEMAEEHEALLEGRAIAVRHCYECWFKEPGNKGSATADSGPYRAVICEKTVNVADPTAAYVLSCGHTVIDL
jgi:hypothetical protein